MTSIVENLFGTYTSPRRERPASLTQSVQREAVDLQQLRKSTMATPAQRPSSPSTVSTTAQSGSGGFFGGLFSTLTGSPPSSPLSSPRERTSPSVDLASPDCQRCFSSRRSASSLSPSPMRKQEPEKRSTIDVILGTLTAGSSPTPTSALASSSSPKSSPSPVHTKPYKSRTSTRTYQSVIDGRTVSPFSQRSSSRMPTMPSPAVFKSKEKEEEIEIVGLDDDDEPITRSKRRSVVQDDAEVSPRRTMTRSSRKVPSKNESESEEEDEKVATPRARTTSAAIAATSRYSGNRSISTYM